MRGEPALPVVFHTGLNDGLPLPSTSTLRPAMPLAGLTMKTQVEPSPALVHTAVEFCTSPPCGSAVEVISPATWPGARAPLRLSRLTMRIVWSLPTCTARGGYFDVAGRMTGPLLPRSTALFCSVWEFVRVELS